MFVLSTMEKGAVEYYYVPEDPIRVLNEFADMKKIQHI